MRLGIKRAIKSIPVIGPLATKLADQSKSPPFKHSTDYWERRYKLGGNSGAGSYNRLAEFKAEVINGFVEENNVHSVIEFGSGDGAQLELAAYPKYTGVDVSHTAIARTRAKFGERPDFTFYQSDDLPLGSSAEVALSLDVLYHLVEDEVFDRYMSDLFNAATRAVIIYSSNEDKAWGSAHVRHRRFQTWIETHRPSAVLLKHIPNRYPYDPADPDLTSFANFYIYSPI